MSRGFYKYKILTAEDVESCKQQALRKCVVNNPELKDEFLNVYLPEKIAVKHSLMC